ncbi:MAG TPA: serine hydrolase, partial [Woeseiaceae bacterium]|nr:serine hydrolase [Woeseiaceae bacterium]
MGAKQRLSKLLHLLQAHYIHRPEGPIPYEDPSNTETQAENSGDMIGFTLDRPMAPEPGTAFAYNSGATALLSQTFLELPGTRVDEYAREPLFRPLGIRDFHRRLLRVGGHRLGRTGANLTYIKDPGGCH